MRSTLLLSLLCVAAAGCHDHGTPDDMAMNDMSAGGDDMSIADMGPPDDARQYVSFTDFAQHFAQTLCAHYMACGQVDSAQLQACIERNLRHTGWDQNTEITKGRMQINELQCLDAIKNARCDFSDSAAWASRCQQFLYKANQPNGAACLGAEECTSGFCQHGGSDAGMAEQPAGCPGVCADPKPTGAPCRVSTDCGAGSYCDRFGTQKCVMQGGPNSACTNLLGVGTGPDCQFGLFCPLFPSSGPPTCTVPSMQTALHGACDPLQGGVTATPACAAGMYCQVSYTASATACTGQPNECYPGYCDTGAGKCMAMSGGTCETKLAAGADCDPRNESIFTSVDRQCVDANLCTKLPGQTKTTCQPYGGAAAACGTDDDCKIGLSCVGGKCTAWFSDGQACDVFGHCPAPTEGVRDVCIADNADAGSTKTCQPVKNVGEACVPGFEDALCETSDLPGSTACVPTSGGTGVCAPKCY